MSQIIPKASVSWFPLQSSHAPAEDPQLPRQRSIATRILRNVAAGWVLAGGGLCCFPITASAQDDKTTATRIVATEPVALVLGRNETLNLRGFELKEVKELRFPQSTEVRADIKETKDAEAAKGLDNQNVGDTHLVVELTLPQDLAPDTLDYVLVTEAGEAQGTIRVFASESVVDEVEPNNGFREPQEFSLGQVVRGNLQSDRDVDVFKFHAKANQQFKIAVTSGGPLLMDAELTCYDDRYQWLASSDDTQSRDPASVLRVTEDGIIFVVVSSAHDFGGTWHSYLLTVEIEE